MELCRPLNSGAELLLVDRKRNEFLHAQMHRFHEQVRIEHLAHDEKAGSRELPRQRCNLFEILMRARININDRQLRRVRTRQNRRERIQRRILRHQRHAEGAKEFGQLLAVGWIAIDDH